jgi:hypothetical protein
MRKEFLAYCVLWIISGFIGTEYLCKNVVSNKEDITYGFYSLCVLTGPTTLAPIIVHHIGELGPIERFQD